MEYQEQRECREMVYDWLRYEEWSAARFASLSQQGPDDGPSRIEAEHERRLDEAERDRGMVR